MHPRYDFVTAECDADQTVLRDLGPWDQHDTITARAEQVFTQIVAAKLVRTHVLYYNSNNELWRLVHQGDKFVCVSPWEDAGEVWKQMTTELFSAFIDCSLEYCKSRIKLAPGASMNDMGEMVARVHMTALIRILSDTMPRDNALALQLFQQGQSSLEDMMRLCRKSRLTSV